MHRPAKPSTRVQFPASSPITMTKRNLIFLDFDGVLNSLRSTTAYGTKCSKKIIWDAEGLDEVAVRLVRRLSEEAPAEVVISSSWRHHFPIEQIKKFLAAKGWPEAPVIGETPKYKKYEGIYASGGERYTSAFRGNEVGSFLAAFTADGNDLGTWVILDDSKDFHYGETSIPGPFFSKQPVVNTSDMIGFSIVDFYEALKILNPEHPLLTNLEGNLING
jgi:hypothetical protein